MIFRAVVFGLILMMSLYLTSVFLPIIKNAKHEYQLKCPSNGFHVGQMVTIKIDGRSAIVYSKYCYRLELKYFADGRYRYETLKIIELE